MAQRKPHTTKFKKRVALDAIKDQLTVAELARKHQVHPSQIKAWKKILIEQSDGLFEHKNKRRSTSSIEDKDRDELLRIIGKMQVENEFLKKRSDDADDLTIVDNQYW